jgi:hypothetical protein
MRIVTGLLPAIMIIVGLVMLFSNDAVATQIVVEKVHLLDTPQSKASSAIEKCVD